MLYNFDELSFQILAIARFSHKKGRFFVGKRPFAALSYRVSGTGVFRVGGKRLSVRPGDVLFLPSDTPYEVEYSESESIVVHLKDCNYAETEVFALSEAAELFSRLLTDWEARHSVHRAKAEVYGILDRIEQAGESPSSLSAIDGCVSYIDAHFCEPTLSIGGVCELHYVSASSLERAFSTRFGISAKQYLIRLRMRHALRLLAEGTHAVKEVAYLCGFTDEKYFSRAFKRAYGYPPSQFRGHMAI